MPITHNLKLVEYVRAGGSGWAWECDPCDVGSSFPYDSEAEAAAEGERAGHGGLPAMWRTTYVDIGPDDDSEEKIIHTMIGVVPVLPELDANLWMHGTAWRPTGYIWDPTLCEVRIVVEEYTPKEIFG